MALKGMDTPGGGGGEPDIIFFLKRSIFKNKDGNIPNINNENCYF
jgi:hypothetical protein